MHRVILSVNLLFAVMFCATAPAEAAMPLLGLAPLRVVTDGGQAKPKRMLSMLAQKVKKLKADGKDEDATAAIKRAHQRVREREEQLGGEQKQLHDIVERLGKGKDADLDDVRLPKLKKEMEKLQNSAKKLVKEGKSEQAAKLADGVHKRVREGMDEQRKGFATLHEEIQKIAAGVGVEEKGGEGHGHGHGHGHAEGDAEHGHGGHGGHGGHDGHDGHGEHGEHGEHGHGADDHHGEHAHGHGDHDHAKEFKKLQSELNEVRKEIKRVRDMVREIRSMVE